MTIAGVKKVLREIMSEPGPAGTLSWGRIGSSVALISAIVMLAHFHHITGSFPAAEQIRSLTEFVSAPYVGNKAASAIQAFSQNPVSQGK